MTKYPRACSILFLIFLDILLNIPMYGKDFIPIHDTLLVYSGFFNFYNNLYWYNHPQFWLPFGFYGWQGDLLQLISLSPFDYFVTVLGALFRIKDTLFLFKTAIFIEQIAFIIGTYLLAELLFRQISTRLFVSIISVLSIVLYAQIYLNFRLYYLFPFLIYFLLQSFKKLETKYVFYCGITAIGSSLGNPPYFLSLWFFLVFMFVMSWLIAKRHHINEYVHLIKNNNRIITSSIQLIALILIMYLYETYAFHSVDYTAFLTNARDPNTGKVPEKVFLTYGGIPNIKDLFVHFFSGFPTHLSIGSGKDNSFFIGTLSVFFTLWAFAKVRDWRFICIASLFISLVLLSFGGLFSKIIYHFPLMAYYRHIGLVYPLAKIFLIYCSGFGWEDYFYNKYDFYRLRFIAFFLVSVTAILLEVHKKYLFIYKSITYLTCAIYFLIKSNRYFQYLHKIKFQQGVLIAITLFELIIYQINVYKEMPKLTGLPFTDMKSDPFLVNKPNLSIYRGEKKLTKRQRNAFYIINYPGGLAKYEGLLEWVQYDPCFPEFRTDWLPRNASLILGPQKPSLEPFQMAVLGCTVPKLRLTNARQILKKDKKGNVIFNGSLQNKNNKWKVQTDALMSKISYKNYGKIVIRYYWPDGIKLDVLINKKSGAYLEYADSNFPGWKATVNDAPVKIISSNLAFKSVHLKYGHSSVSLIYQPKLRILEGYLIFAFGILFSFFIFSWSFLHIP